MAAKLDLSIHATVPTASVTNTLSFPPEEISSVKMVPFNIFSVWTALSANFAFVTASAANSVVPTAPAAISKVTSPSNALISPPTVKSEEVMFPSPVIAVPSTSNAPVDTFCTRPLPATFELILAAVTASSANSLAVIPPVATSNV
jgi:hypothetical protein